MNLPASAYRPGDRVIGEADGETCFGRVSNQHAIWYVNCGDVLIRWNDERYDEGFIGHRVEASLLRLWPAAAHEARVAELHAAAEKEPHLP